MIGLDRLIVVVIAGLLLGGCGNTFNRGSSAAPPTDVIAVPGDGSVTVTWTMAPNVQYWLFYAPTNVITEANWTTIPGSNAIIGATSPAVISGLSNGTTYAFMINGRVNGGPGGADSPSISAVPRLAGVSWQAGGPLCGGTCILNGETHGGVFVAVGNGGYMFSSPDGVGWTPLANPTAPLNLSAAAQSAGNYVVVGVTGIILFSSDAVNWAQKAINSTNDLAAVASNGSGVYVAVGKGGTIVFSSDGQNWIAPPNPIVSPVTTDLYGVAYGNGLWVAVGSGGAILTSPDAINWATVTSNTAADLKAVTIGVNANTGTNLFVAVGAAGTIVTSPDAVTWSVPPQVNVNLNAVTYGRQFVAVGDVGAVLTSTDGANWQSQTSGTSANLNAVAPNGTGYSAVGADGVDLSAY